MKKTTLFLVSLFTSLFFQNICYSAIETGLNLNEDMMGLRITKNRKNPIKSGLMNLQILKKENKYYIAGSYNVEKKWWLPIKRKDTLVDREIPSVIANYDLLMSAINEMKQDEVNVKSFGFGQLILVSTETVNGVQDCLRIKVQSGIGEIDLWIHPTQELNYDDFRAPIFVKVLANAELPIVGKKLFELNLELLNHKRL